MRKINPPNLNWFSFKSFNFRIILFIFPGNIAYKNPSRNKKRPNAMINSFIIIYCGWELIFPKNLKNSLSGDKIKEVSPPISAVSYACIAR